jgi:hypothetical protein
MVIQDVVSPNLVWSASSSMIREDRPKLYRLLKRAGQGTLSELIDKPPVRYLSVIESPEADANLIANFLWARSSEMIPLLTRKVEPFLAMSAIHVRVPRCSLLVDTRAQLREEVITTVRPVRNYGSSAADLNAVKLT